MNMHVLTAEPVGKRVIQLLEDALERARAGEVSSVALAMVDREGCIDTGWSKPPSFGLLLAAATRLQHRLNQRMDDA